jgi:serine/threonine protein phosphatase PrpC
MGAHANGQEASSLAITTLTSFLLQHLAGQQIPSYTLVQELLKAAVQLANRTIWQKNGNLKDRDAMGTTLTALLSVGAQAFCANVGDSRIYRMRQGEHLIQITRDHSTVWQLYESGEIRREDIYTHQQRNEIYRSLGAQEQVEMDLFGGAFQDGDHVLLCSDGLWELIPDEAKIERILAHPTSTLEQMAGSLVDCALEGGGHDNISVIVADVRTITSTVPVPLHSALTYAQAS